MERQKENYINGARRNNIEEIIIKDSEETGKGLRNWNRAWFNKHQKKETD